MTKKERATKPVRLYPSTALRLRKVSVKRDISIAQLVEEVTTGLK